MALTLNQVIQSLNDIATSHRQINHFFFGEMYDFASSGTTLYPAMIAEKEPDILEGSTLKMVFNIYLTDLVHKDISNRQEVLSDMQRVALDVIYQLTHPDYEWVIDNSSITLNDFVDKFDDEVTGYWFRLVLKISSPFDRCAIPKSPIEIGSSACPSVRILNSNGDVIATVAAGGSYTVVGGSCDDATVQNSDGSYSQSVASGGSLTLPDNTYRVYVNGALNQTATGASVKAQTINISWLT